ncbi:DUF202 domain-containing protein [Hutsoniella sourekii]
MINDFELDQLIDNQDLSTNEQLALIRTFLASERTDKATLRTAQASQRTYAAWVRTGFSITSAGTALGQLLKSSPYANVSIYLAYALVTIGLLAFVFGWLGYSRDYHYKVQTIDPKSPAKQRFRQDYLFISLFSFFLLAICIAAYYLLYLTHNSH